MHSGEHRDQRRHKGTPAGAGGQSTDSNAYQALVEASPVAMALHAMEFDEAGEPVDYTFLATNAAFDRHTGLRGSEIIGRNVTDVLPGIRETPFIQMYGDVVRTGQPTVFEQFSPPLGRTYAVHAYPVSEHQFATVFQDITKQKKVEGEREQALKLLEGIYASVQDGICVLNTDLTVRNANKPFQDWFALGTPIEGEKCYRVYHGMDAPCDPCPAVRCMKTGRVESEIKRAIPGSEAEWLEVFCYPMKDANTGNVTGVVEFVRDVTERLRMEATLRHQSDLLNEVGSIARIGGWEYVPATSVGTWTPMTARIHDLDPEDPEGIDAAREAYHGEHRAKMEAAMRDAMESGSPFDLEAEIVTRRGNRKWVRMVGVPVVEHGKTGRIRGFIQDISELKASKDALQQNSQRLEAFLRISRALTASPDPSTLMQLIVDDATRVMRLETGALYLLEGASIRLAATTPHLPNDFPEEYRYASLDEHPHIKEALVTAKPVVIPDTRAAALTPAELEIVRLRNLRSILYLPVRLMDQSIGVLILSATEKPTPFPEEEIVLLQGFADQAAQVISHARLYEESRKQTAELKQEVAQRKRVEQALVDEGERLREAQAIAHVGSWEYDAPRNHLVWSDETHRMFGTKRGSFEETYEAFLDRVHPEDRPEVEALYARSLEEPGVTYEVEHRMIRSDTGEERTVYEKCRHERDADGRVVRSVGIVHDITDLRKVEAAREEAVEELRASEERFRDLFDESPVPTAEADYSHIRQAMDRLRAVGVSDLAAYLETNPDVLRAWIPAIHVKRANKAAMEMADGDPGQVRAEEAESPLLRSLLVGLFEGHAQVGGRGMAVDPQGNERHILMRIRAVPGYEASLERVLVTMQDETEQMESRRALERSYEAVQATLGGAVHALSVMGELRDPYTAGHQSRVAALASLIAEALGFDDARVAAIRIAGELHDTGKIYIPAEILNKPTQLSSAEWKLLMGHARQSYEIVKQIPFVEPIADMVLQHHERLDGSGYPQGLVGDQIFPEARILAIADTVEAMASHRPYRPALGLEAALDEIRSGRGRRYDPDAVDACLRLFDEGLRLEDLPLPAEVPSV